jgi:hypothetical protein
MYKNYTNVPDDMLPLRQVVLARKQPRKLLVQHVTVLAPDGSVGLKREFTSLLVHYLCSPH